MLAAILGHTVALDIFVSDPALSDAFAVRLPGLAASIMCILLASIAIWLILGVGTRTVALSGTALYLAHDMLLAAPGVPQITAMHGSFIVVFLALPLIIFGGGRFSLNAALPPEPA